MTDALYDVFISYSSPDKAWVAAFARRLHSYGLKVWFDQWEVLAGDPIVAKVNDGLARSRAAIVVYSPKSVASGWVQGESAAAFKQTVERREPSGAITRLIPIRLAPCEIPPLPSTLRIVDFAGVDAFTATYEDRVREIVDALRPAERPVDPPTVVPVVVAAMVRSEVEALFDGSAFSDQDVRIRVAFESFRHELTRCLPLTAGSEGNAASIETPLDVRSLVVDRYDETSRDEWCPFPGVATSVRTFLEQRPGETSALRLEYWSDELLPRDTALAGVARDVGKMLRERGCVLVIDPLALFHPELSRMVQRRELTGRSNVTVLCMSPLNLSVFGVFKTMRKELEETFEALWTRIENFDPLCAVGIEDPLGFGLWLRTQLPHAVAKLSKEEPDPNRLGAWAKAVSQSPVPNDRRKPSVAGLFPGGGGA